MKMKSITMIMAVVVMIVGLVSGTLAWLTDSSDQVTNTFTTSDIEVTLTETERTYQMIPGYTLSKDPTAKVSATSIDCYLFVKLDKSNNFDNFLTYEIEDGWTELTGTGITAGTVYYKIIDETTSNYNKNTDYNVLKNNQVTVKTTVKKKDMEALTDATYPTLTVTAYASQYRSSATDIIEPLTAWNNINS